MPRFAAGLLLAALAAATAGCAKVPPPPYPLAFGADIHSPRLLETSSETTVALLVTNMGQRAWDPARIHVSYHWLWLVPRELARRSRTVPYHDGIRTGLGDRSVSPGARIALEGRLLPPAWPGVYWLQWDMVEEGVGWFAQVSPRQPRSLVVVLPPLAWMVAPLPLGIVLWALYRLRRANPRTSRHGTSDSGAVTHSASRSADAIGAGVTQRFTPAMADVLWCAASLAVKPLILAHDALLEPSAVAYWLILATALSVPLVVALLLPGRVRHWALFAIGIFGSLVILGDVVYYRFFGDVLSVPALLAAHQTGHVWGSIASLFTPGLLWLVIDWPFAGWLAFRLSRTRASGPSWRARALALATTWAVLAIAGVALSAPRVLASTPLDQMFRDRSVVEQLGPFGFHLYDSWNSARARWLRPPLTDAQVDDAVSWFAMRAPLRAGVGPAFGAARGRNLIVVQVESLQDFVVDFRVNGQEVMPHLRRWTADSLRFTNVTDQTSEGRTSDAEFTTLASLLPLDHGAAAFRFPGNHYAALPTLLTEHGYATMSAVAFEPGFWNRQVMHPSYGFRRSYFESDFQLTEQIGWGLNDRDFLQQMVPRLEALPRPFGAWLITLSLHHPFEDFPEKHKVLKLGAIEGTSFGNYLHTMKFFDEALDSLKSALARDGLLDESVLVVFGDHDAGFARDPALARTMGIGGDEVAWAMNDRVPLFVRIGRAKGAGAAGEEGLVGERSLPAGQTDLAPTLLALLGIDPAPLPYVGRNLLGAPGDQPVPRPYGDWLDGSHLFLSRSAPICYDLARRVLDSVDACRAADAPARRERELSRLVVIEDLQARLRARLNAIAR